MSNTTQISGSSSQLANTFNAGRLVLSTEDQNALQQDRNTIATLHDDIMPEGNRKEALRLLENPIIATTEEVLHLWRIAEERKQYFPGLITQVIHIGPGNEHAGYKHMLKGVKSRSPDMKVNYPNFNGNQLVEVMQATTQVGRFVELQGGADRLREGTARPIFVLKYNSVLIAVALTIGNNGWVVGMNWQSVRKYTGDPASPNHVPPGDFPQYNSVKSVPDRALGEEHFRYSHPDAAYILMRGNKEVSRQSEAPIGDWVYMGDYWGPKQRAKWSMTYSDGHISYK